MKSFAILNITPDSFSDGGEFENTDLAMKRAAFLMESGADILDIGGESTRPGARSISPIEEWSRVCEIVSKCIELYGGDRVSLDTRNPFTALEFLKIGGGIVNDVSGVRSPEMINVLSGSDCKFVINHFPGDTVAEVHERLINDPMVVRDDLLERVEKLRNLEFDLDRIILDPGIGFGKTPECNLELLEFKKYVPELPVLIGHSRKRFLGTGRMELPANRLATKVASLSGADYVRIHDMRYL